MVVIFPIYNIDTQLYPLFNGLLVGGFNPSEKY